MAAASASLIGGKPFGSPNSMPRLASTSAETFAKSTAPLDQRTQGSQLWTGPVFSNDPCAAKRLWTSEANYANIQCVSRIPHLSRIGVASVAVVVAFILAGWVASYRTPDTHFNFGPDTVFGDTVPASNVYFYGTPPTHSPGWAVPLAVLVGAVGLGSAAFVFHRR